ncbi:hypothetical protein SLEP1_g34355 [Rubroshorea leprosula]|uniref:Uncharacterized protein n=1 Tax=Rubroshorea leprosula TaxID=152421 RepID=A0AAV5KJJ0_9ROSI|nr:hypothetical protein SLEP1_g34355 [Rubroshorea leprosula]
MAGIVPSTLHQKLKYIVGNSLVMVNGEKDYAIHKATSVPYVEVESQNQEATYYSIEFVSTTYVAKGSVLRTLDLSRVSKGVAKVMLENHFEVGKGLRIGLQGIEEPIESIDITLKKENLRSDWIPITYNDEVIVEDASDDEDMGAFDLFKSLVSTHNDGSSTSFEKLSISVIYEGRDDDKVILLALGETLDNWTVEILLVPIIKL